MIKFIAMILAVFFISCDNNSVEKDSFSMVVDVEGSVLNAWDIKHKFSTIKYASLIDNNTNFYFINQRKLLTLQHQEMIRSYIPEYNELSNTNEKIIIKEFTNSTNSSIHKILYYSTNKHYIFEYWFNNKLYSKTTYTKNFRSAYSYNDLSVTTNLSEDSKVDGFRKFNYQIYPNGDFKFKFDTSYTDGEGSLNINNDGSGNGELEEKIYSKNNSDLYCIEWDVDHKVIDDCTTD